MMISGSFEKLQTLCRIHFNSSGKLSGADMVVYLLEKSRLTYQQPLERCYHAFYNMMSDQVPDLKAKVRRGNKIRNLLKSFLKTFPSTVSAD